MWFQSKSRFYNLDTGTQVIDETGDMHQTPRARIVFKGETTAHLVDGQDAYRLIALLRALADGMELVNG